MITAVAGKKLITVYNQKHSKNLSAKEFFEEVFFPVVLDSEKYLFWEKNTPFTQGISKKDPNSPKYKPFYNKSERLNLLQQFHRKVINGQRDASIAIGYSASDEKGYNLTSGLVTDLQRDVSEEEVYCSWIGACLGVTVKGISILFDDSYILLKLLEGWKVYRNLLDDPLNTNLAPNKINSWNGQWLTYCTGKDFDPSYDYASLDNFGFFEEKDEKTIVIRLIEWPRLFFSLSYALPNQHLNSYLYILNKSNTTVGFVPFQLKAGRRIKKVYDQLFPKESYANIKVVEALFGEHILQVAKLGSIGLQALRPEKLKEYFTNESSLKLDKKTLKPKKGETEEEYQDRVDKNSAAYQSKFITYKVYKTWLIAMLSRNKEEITDYTTELARMLHEYRSAGRKTDRVNLLEKELLAAPSKKKFIEALEVIIRSVSDEYLQPIKQLRDEVHLMTNEEFGYFNTLLKFDYSFQERNN
ncbi:hypothetical protein [Algivirga pacifica]|uniref:Uncharacterized protein n=1 Tax=Algivirga pacifica TaxID=1162670 RepID=A0ABP9DKJ7_9BACT